MLFALRVFVCCISGLFWFFICVVYTHAHTHACAYTYTHECMHTHMRVHARTHTHTHTHTHTLFISVPLSQYVSLPLIPLSLCLHTAHVLLLCCNNRVIYSRYLIIPHRAVQLTTNGSLKTTCKENRAKSKAFKLIKINRHTGWERTN